MNSWSALISPSLMSARSSSRNFWSYQSSQSRVARSASMPLAVWMVARLSADRLRPWICRALTLNRPPYQPKARWVFSWKMAWVRPS